MKKGIRIALAAFFAVCLICFVFIKAFRLFMPYTEVIENNWGIALPSYGMKEIFSYSQPSPHGDGVRYHVLDYRAGDETKKGQDALFQLAKLFSGAPVPDEDEAERMEHLVGGIPGIPPRAALPRDGRCLVKHYVKEDGSELYLLRKADTETVYVIENFI